MFEQVGDLCGSLGPGECEPRLCSCRQREGQDAVGKVGVRNAVEYRPDQRGAGPGGPGLPACARATAGAF